MCGIVGIIGSDPTNAAVIENMLSAQQHRGPDSRQVCNDDSIYLGHNRLSIIDLSTHADQPMHSTCGNYVVVFNGEIYNYLEIKQQLASHYTFKTSSDTEVLLAAYIVLGKHVLEQLNGMFSFAN